MAPKLKNQKKKSNKKESQSYLADDENFQSFSNQLAKIGLELRDITGDGNCCFRALSDQMVGDENQHLIYRKNVCNFMRENREDFEPFVVALIADNEDEENNGNGNRAIGKTRQATREFANSAKKVDAFEKYIRNLEQPGTYADNGCLVAFARLNQVDINIHQLNLEIWTINGTNMAKNGNNRKDLVRQLHLSYHNGEHYSSIRPIGDKSKNPTNININEVVNTNGNNSKAKGKPKSNSSNSLPQNTKEINGASSSDYSNNNNNNDSYTYQESLFSDHYCAKGDNNNNHLNGDYLVDDEGQPMSLIENDTEKINEKINQIIEITKCFDLSLIKTKLSENQNDVSLTIGAVISQRPKEGAENDLIDEIYLSSGGEGSNNSVKIDKKQEKKQRQMERQKIKVLELKEKEAHIKIGKENFLKNKNIKLIDPEELATRANIQQQQNDPQSNEPPKIELNVQTKSI
jgi:hypothetical protein